MSPREGKRDQGTPGMPEYSNRVDVHLFESTIDKIGLGFGSPDLSARAGAVTESRSVETNHAILLRQQSYESTRLEILNHAAVAMKQENRLSGAMIEIV